MTQQEQDKRNELYSEMAVLTGHYHYFMQALAVAMLSTTVWRLTATGDPFTLKQLFKFAKKRDERNELDDEHFYMVSREGAIGLSPGLEYLTEWIFIPMEPGEERDRMMRQMQDELRLETAEREAVEAAVDKGLLRKRLLQTTYLIWNGGEQVGPFTVEQMVSQLHITADTLIWHEGMSAWAAAGTVEGIAELLRERDEAAAKPAPQATRQPVADSTASYLMLNAAGQPAGPFSVAELKAHGLTPSTLIYDDKRSQWVIAIEVEGLKTLFN